MKMWKWLKESTIVEVVRLAPKSFIIVCVTFIIALAMMFGYFPEPDKTSYTSHADCTLAMELHDKELKESQAETKYWEDSYIELAMNYKLIARGACYK